ncbi:unnamed protein product [Spirodela intermedia]|uniref:Uncharacterized protein n=1 Tax=Spirodela intermedia TaxID=51605 RepID=A0A7I8IPQ6_SPIIN|nr:unnamed protein product [Spirodela intermedia]CAA6659929.1 unnamed protein product [Spirodela intermedia]
MGALAHRRLAELAQSYGASRLMALSLGTTRVIISSHPETAREILCGPAFTDRPAKESARLLMFERAIGFSPPGTTGGTCAAIAGLEGLRQRVAGGMIEGVREEMERRGVVELRGVLQRGSLESVLGVSLGRAWGARERRSWWRWTISPWEASSISTAWAAGARSSPRRSDASWGTHRGEKDQRRPPGDDFLSVLLALPKEESLSDYDITAVLWEMIFRGTDVVAIVLEWVMARMAVHPEVQAKVQEEIAGCLAGASRSVRDVDMPSLPYLQAVVKEVLRLHPQGRCSRGPGWRSTTSTWARPSCQPGRQPWSTSLGLATVNLWLARLLQHYSWSPGRPVVFAEQLRLSMEMKKPLACRAVPR